MTITALSTRLGNVTGIFHLRGGKFPVTSGYEEIVRQQIVDAVTTNARERIMRPDYGADIQSLLFDASDSLVQDDVASAVKERLRLLVPRANIKSVTLETNPVLHGIDGIDAEGPAVVLITVVYATRLIEGSLAVVVPNMGANNGNG